MPADPDTPQGSVAPTERTGRSRRTAAERTAARVAGVGLQPVVALRNARVIADADIDAVVDAYLADPKAGLHPLGRTGYTLDLAAAVRAHRPSQAAAGDRSLGEAYRRELVRTAILLAIPNEP